MPIESAPEVVVASAAHAMRDYSQSQGGAAIGARLRRLSERIDRDANRVYSQLGVVFEQRWMGVLNLLSRGPMSVNELAAALGISHPSISQTKRSLQTARLIVERADPKDGRRRSLHLTLEGEALVEKLQPVWLALSQASQVLNAEAGDLVCALTRLEEALDRHSLFKRVTDSLASDR